jgi:hypothetical protein
MSTFNVLRFVGSVPACDVPWCRRAARVVCYRSESDRKALRGKSKMDVQPERKVCETHMPEWRRDVYLPIGSPRPAEVTQPTKAKRGPRREHHCQGCTCPVFLPSLEVA